MQNKLIRSYGRRKARKLRDTSQKAYEELLPLLRLDLTGETKSSLRGPEGRGNPWITTPSTRARDDGLFCDTAQPEPPEVWLEIGFGGGEHMLEQLARHPSISMIGCEPFMNGVAKLLTHLLPEDYPRVKVWHEDVRLLLRAIPPSYFNRAFILFPDPWPKKRHHCRRLITKDFMDQLYPTLKDGALLHIASDDVPYVEQIQEVLYDYPGLKRCQGPASADPLTWSPRPEGWPATRYEQKALAKGKPCTYMVFQKGKGRGSSV